MSNTDEEREQDNIFHQDLRLAWDYTILAMTKVSVLVEVHKEQAEYVSYCHDNKGNCFSGFYTQDKNAAKINFIDRSMPFI